MVIYFRCTKYDKRRYTMLVRFDQFRDDNRLADQFDQIWRRPSSTVAMDAYRHGEVTIDVDLPGVDPDAIDLTVKRDVDDLGQPRVGSQ